MTEPKRLVDTEEVPEAFRTALRGLGERAPLDAAAVARVEQAIQAFPAASAGASAAASVAWIKLSGMLVLAGLGGALAFQQVESVRKAPAQQAGVPVVRRQAAPASRELARPLGVELPTPPSAAQLPGVPQPSAADQEAAVRGSIAAESGPTRNARRTAVRSESADAWTRSSAEGTRREPASRASAVEAPPTRPEQAAPPSAAGLRPTAEQPALAPPEAAAPEDEAGALYRIRRLAAHDPALALRQLDALARFFPQGTLAEERAALGIRLHQRLGHTAEARRLVSEFRARFPRSMYRVSDAP